MDGEKFNLSWNDFESNACSSYRKLVNDTHFTDVTLACDDNRQIKAHKVVLSSSSPVLKQILLGNPHQHPLIYLCKVKYSSLESLIKFIYLGQTEVAQSELQDFMSMAEEFEVEGLKSKLEQINEDKNNGSVKEKSEELSFENSSLTFVMKSELISSELVSLDQLNFVNNEDKCEARTDGNELQCNQCFRNFSNISNLQQHKNSSHEGVRHPCDQCEYKGTTKSNLKRHKHKVHTQF